MRQIAILLPLLVSSVVLPVAPAAAGGVSWFEFDHRFYLPGEVAIGRGAFDAHLRGQARISDGPFSAYLLPTDRERWWIDPPTIPEGAIRVGVVGFRDPNLDGKWFDAVAVVRFVVPQVPSGFYQLGICNDPCRDAMVGDLYGGSIAVAQTAGEGQLLLRSRRLGWRLDDARREVRRLARIGDRAASRAEAAEAELEDAEAVAALLEGRNAALRRRLGSDGNGDPWLPWALLPLALAIGAAGGVAIAGRSARSRDAAHVPSPELPDALPRVREPGLPRR